MPKRRLKRVAPTSVNRTVPRRLKNSELRTREHLTEKEVERLIKAVGDNRYGHRDATMVLIAFRHGLRASELCDLRWDQVDFARAALHVRRAKNGTPSTHRLTGREMRPCVVFGARGSVHNRAEARMWLRAGEPRTRYPRSTSLPGASVHPAHGAVHRAVVRSVQGLVERLESVRRPPKARTDASPFVGALKRAGILADFSGAAINLGDRRHTAAALCTSPQRARI